MERVQNRGRVPKDALQRETCSGTFQTKGEYWGDAPVVGAAQVAVHLECKTLPNNECTGRCITARGKHIGMKSRF